MTAATICTEFASIDLGDKRLNRRAMDLLNTLAANPLASINAACIGWADTQAAYRFFSNDNVDPDAILTAHANETKERMAREKVVLVVQDTTELDFSSHPTKDSGVLNTTKRFGMYDHSQIAFTPDKLCLGVLAADFYSRTPESLEDGHDHKAMPIEEKESLRWLEGYRFCCELQNEFKDTQIVCVADREGDIYDIFLERQSQATPADFVIRANAERSLPEKDPQAGPYTYKKVHDELRQSDCKLTRVIDLPTTPKRKARTATLEIRAMKVTVIPPRNRRKLPNVTYNVVLVEEVGGPDDDTKVSWTLMTTLPIDSNEAILKVIDYYVARWGIEVFFRVFKSGCKVEDIQLETEKRRLRCLMFYKVIAWRLMYLTYLGRECPELPCDVMFAEAEWQPVWRIVKDEPLPAKPPTLGDFILMVAHLGGYNSRRHDAAPGPEVIWRGLRRMIDFSIAWKAFEGSARNGAG